MNKQTNSIKNLYLAGLGVLTAVGTVSAQDFSTPTTIPQYPGGSFGTPVTVGGELYATGGNVSVTYLGWDGASYDEQLYVDTSGGDNLVGTPLMDNHATAAGTTVNLGSFTAGTEVEFSIYVDNTQNTWHDGPGSRNADGVVHAYTINDFDYTITSSSVSSYVGDAGEGTYVGFEDESYPGGDFNYADLQFVFDGVEGVGEPGQPTVPDGGTTLALLGLSLGALGGVSRKFKK